MQLNLGRNNAIQGVAGKLGTSLFLFIFFLVGTVFFSFMAYEFWNSCAPYFWDEVPCRVVSSEIVQAKSSSSEDNFKIKYKYRYKSKKYSSEKFCTVKFNHNSAKARRYKQKYHKGLTTKCYVNPGEPSEAVIHREMLWIMLPFMLIPLVFMAVGGGGIYFTWKKEKDIESNAAAVKKRMKPENQRKLLIVFFSLFFLAGLAIAWLAVIHPLMKIRQSENWARVRATIVSSRVKESRGDKSTTYRVDISFKYKFNGIEYVGGTYDFMTGSDGDYRSKRKIVNRYPPGKSAYCYVNPENPTEAVISREFNNSWRVAVLSSVFMLVGVGGIIGTLVKRKKRNHIYLTSREPDADIGSPGGETVLKMKASPLQNFAGVLLFALFWNGIVSIFVTQAVKSWGTNHVEWLLSFFMIPFVLIGLGALAAVVYCFIALFNSKAIVAVSNSRPQLGEKVTVSWKIANSASIDKLEIFLRAEETAVYQTGGKNNRSQTAKNTFEELTLLNTTNREAIHMGKTQFVIPLNSMHSFDAPNNKITWLIVLHGDIKRRPDLKCEYPITVMPLTQESLHKILRSAENGEDNG